MLTKKEPENHEFCGLWVQFSNLELCKYYYTSLSIKLFKIKSRSLTDYGICVLIFLCLYKYMHASISHLSPTGSNKQRHSSLNKHTYSSFLISLCTKMETGLSKGIGLLRKDLFQSWGKVTMEHLTIQEFKEVLQKNDMSKKKPQEKGSPLAKCKTIWTKQLNSSLNI